MCAFAVINRLKHFLPQMEAANSVLDKHLADNSHADVNIESLEGCENSIIEMVSNCVFCIFELSEYFGYIIYGAHCFLDLLFFWG